MPEHTRGDTGDKAVVLYDSNCRFCRWSLARLLRLDRRRSLRPVALDSPEADSLLGEMSPQERFGSWHLAVPGSTVRSGGAAVAPLTGRLTGSARAERLVGYFTVPLALGYQVVARSRGRLGRLVGDRADARARSLIEEREAV